MDFFLQKGRTEGRVGVSLEERLGKGGGEYVFAAHLESLSLPSIPLQTEDRYFPLD